MASAQKAWIERIQKRLAVTSTMLGDMKAAQMLGLKDLLFNIINELRKLELKDSLRYRKIMVIIVVLCKFIRTHFFVLFPRRYVN